jgi:AraC family transcriptional regulator of adaptative response/methylated-DNA-[protein]-cysteine methyltransferase
MAKLAYPEMLQAMRKNDASYDGKFYVGVQSTGIYCLPSCKAKLPQLKNVVFYPTRQQAIAAGLRGCKRCRAERFPDVLPAWLHRVLNYMRQHRDQKLREGRLKEIAGVDIPTIRRNFKQRFKMTPLAFHRALRLNYARNLIRSGSSYLNAAYESGFESSSGFRQAFFRQFGYPPGRFYVKR